MDRWILLFLAVLTFLAGNLLADKPDTLMIISSVYGAGFFVTSYIKNNK